ncbi:MAG: 2-C-methyl-D-erythritol 4-phosphate cytidylyltransferase [Clostridia bacterium]|nr:2-C-methyl-D-erythritol 4-phosphate cytidylyltransferase [Clostridia bacterium]
MNIGIILAAGLSERFKSTVHKQYLKLNGKEVIFYSIDAMKKAECFDKIIVVVDEDEFKAGYIGNKYNVECICGGNTRNKSISNTLEYVHQTYPDTEKIVFHDCSRPFVKSDVFRMCIDTLNEYNAVAMTNEITDSLVTQNGTFINRRDFLLVQTPEGFRFDVIYKDFDTNKQDTAIVNQIHDKSKINLFNNNAFNFKITYPQDLFLAEQLMRIDFVHTSQITSKEYCINGKVLLFGGSGGVGQTIIEKLKELNITYYAPTHRDLDLSTASIEDIEKACPFSPDIIINVAATYENDDTPLLDSFDKIFNVNLKSNLVIIEYAKTLNKQVNIVVMS